MTIQDTGRRQTNKNTICVGNCVNRDSNLLNHDNCYSTKTTPNNSQNNDKVYYSYHMETDMLGYSKIFL